ncbi:roadblock/LC7 domain-containing protein [Streptomyces sp. NRRL B-24484]|uniref:roadblock/LC7 domain-containing protein n=1 Tax=Streptomyces sp. NRRL B-24484 TaxID=1463833 RepID=UPI000693FEEC|nr:roadblock/LC7 domain-containing protein [Streptomyces sp. NRRL B-24484]
MTDTSGDLIAEMGALRGNATGVTGVVVSAVDGLLVAADTEDRADGECLAALAAAVLGLARRAGAATGRDRLRWSAARYGDGYLVVRPVGDMGVLTLLGSADMDPARLDGECEQAVRRIDDLLTAPRTPAAHH